MQRDRLNQIRSLCRNDAAFEVLKTLIPSINEQPLTDEDQAAESDSTRTVSDDLSAFSSQAPPTQEIARLQVLFRIQNSPNLQAIFQTTATELRALLNASRVGIFRFDPDSNWSRGSFISEDAAVGYGSALAIQLEEPCFGAQFAVHYQKGRVRAVEDVYNAGLTPCYVQFLNSLRIRANLTVPLLNQDRLWGLLCVHQCDRPRCWQSWEIKFVQQIGTQLNIALRQGALLQQVKNQAKQQTALIQVISKIHQCSDLDAALTVAVTETRRLLNADRVGIFRFHSTSEWDRGEFVAESVAAGYPSTRQIVVEDRCFGRQYAEHYQRGQIQAVADIYAASLQDCHVDVLAQFDIRANLVIPLLEAGYLWGLLCIHQCDRPRQWQPQEIELAQHVATHLDVVLQQADLMKRSRQQTQNLTNALNHLKAAQAQLVQSEKMSSLGQLVAGIAHEINNPVNFIYGNLTYLDDYCTQLLTLICRYRDCCPDHFKQEMAQSSDEIELDFLIEDLPKIMGSVQIGAERIRDIVLSLQRFAHSHDNGAEAVDLHEGLDNTLLLLQHRLRANPSGPEIKLVKQYGNLPLVECRAGQINQVFLNVLVNAVEALEEQYQRRNPGSRTAHFPPHRGLKEAAGQIQIVTTLEGNDVVICIIDNGPGLSSDVKARVFDPFFTTKPAGKGTGLGLSISHQIVANHRGALEYRSTPGQGTECRMTLPVRQPQA